MRTASIRAEWEGQLIDGRFALLEWLGGTDDRGVFLTVLQGIQKASIKLIPAEGSEADSYIAQWEAAKKLSHPYLIAVLETGRFAFAGTDLVYVVTEYAEKSLSQVVAERALSPGDARGAFDPVLDALSYLHEKGFVHGHVKPSNILMVADQWKLSGDDLLVAGEFPELAWIPGSYDAPEAMYGSITAAMDVWSVGMTLAEALTQDPIARDWAGKGSTKSEPVVPGLPRPFGEIVRGCLRTDPAQRCTTEEVRSLLQRAWTSPTVVEAISAGAGLARMEAEQMRLMAEPAQAAPKPNSTAAEPNPPAEPPISAATQPRWAEEEPASPVELPRAASTQPRWVEEEPAPPVELPKAASTQPRWVEEEPAPTLGGEKRREREERFQEREPADFDRSPTLFADIEEANLTGFPKIPLVIGVLVFLALAGVFLVKTGKIPWPLWPQNAPAASQSAPHPQSPATPPNSTESRLPTGEAPPQSEGAAPAGGESAPQTKQAAPEKQQPGSTAATQTQGATPETRTGGSTKSEHDNAPATGQSAPQEQPSPSEARSAPARSPAALEPKAPETHPGRASAEGGVADRVLPTVPETARQSMHGPREAVVQVFVDQNGRVSNAAYVSSGPGNYFARTAMRAAREWKFSPPIRGGHPQPSVWVLRFNFMPGKAEVSATAERR